MVDTGKGKVYALEVMVLKKLADKLYGIMSGPYFMTRYMYLEGVWKNRAYDPRFIFQYRAGTSLTRTERGA